MIPKMQKVLAVHRSTWRHVISCSYMAFWVMIECLVVNLKLWSTLTEGTCSSRHGLTQYWAKVLSLVAKRWGYFFPVNSKKFNPTDSKQICFISWQSKCALDVMFDGTVIMCTCIIYYIAWACSENWCVWIPRVSGVVFRSLPWILYLTS